ncbi:zincin [Meredithblackwellia eburnea MCA 4105]
MLTAPFILSSLVALVAAAPFSGNKPTLADELKQLAKRDSSWTLDVQIHASCSAAQNQYLRRGLDEMNLLAKHAHDKILSLGEKDPLYVTYFGNGSSAAASGYYAQIAFGNKFGVLLRCDDPDGNCATQTTAAGPWAGHWRGKNATQETVICPPTYNTTNRASLRDLCWDGNKVGGIDGVHYLGADLLHRMTHIPTVAYDHVLHYAEEYDEILEFAHEGNPKAVYNSDTLQLYALDAYAKDVIYPPSGCTVDA